MTDFGLTIQAFSATPISFIDCLQWLLFGATLYADVTTLCLRVTC